MKPVSYRHVSLTSVLSKVIERIFRESIVTHLTENNLLSDRIHGFICNRSCLTSMLCYLDDLANEVDEDMEVDVNYLDCEKAFDWFQHNRLLITLKARWIDGGIALWINDFLGEGYHQVKTRDETSTTIYASIFFLQF